jgi:hypothetical protein
MDTVIIFLCAYLLGFVLNLIIRLRMTIQNQPKYIDEEVFRTDVLVAALESVFWPFWNAIELFCRVLIVIWRWKERL